MDLLTTHTHVLGCQTLLDRHTVVYRIVSLPVVSREALHAATILIREIIARVPTTRMIGHSVVCGIVSQLVVCREVQNVATMLISGITARALTMERMIETVVSLTSLCPDAASKGSFDVVFIQSKIQFLVIQESIALRLTLLPF